MQDALTTFFSQFEPVPWLCYLFPVLALGILIRCAVSLLTFRPEPEVWAWLTTPDGAHIPVTHWESLIGRGAGCDVQLGYPTVSRTHAVLTRYDDGSWTISDAHSKSGVFVNGRQTALSALRFGDVITMGGVNFTLIPLTKEQERIQAGTRTRAGHAVHQVPTLLLLTLFQLLTAIQLILGGCDPALELTAFGGLIGLEWALYLALRAFRRTGFEAETLAFFLCTMGLAVVSSSAPESLIKELLAIVAGVCVFLVVCWSLRDLERAKTVRSTICYDKATDAFCFTTKGGWLCSVKTGKTSDGWQLRTGSKWTLKLENGTSTAQAMSTSTPVVYNGRAYIGVRGTAQFSEYGGHSLTVVDLASHTIAYRVQTQGYPQTSGILTTAYEETTSYVYVYFVDNYTPGKLRVLRDKAGQTRADYVTEESGVDTPYVLFTPSGKDAQYAICSPVVDSYGVMYFKNDSAKLMAFGPSVTLEITRQPDKTQYRAGEVFDPAGMQVDLVYANGLRRDVTKYVQWSEDPLTEEDAAIDIRFPYVRYHDQDSEESGRLTNVKTQTPTASVRLTVEPGTVENGRIGMLTWAYDIKTGSLTISGEFENGQKLAVAYYDQDGRMVQVKLLTQAQTLAAVESGARIRLFLLDQDNQPVCRAMTVKR